MLDVGVLLLLLLLLRLLLRLLLLPVWGDGRGEVVRGLHMSRCL